MGNTLGMKTTTDGGWLCVPLNQGGDSSFIEICGKSWTEKGKVRAAIGAKYGSDPNRSVKTVSLFKANGLTPYAEMFDLTYYPEDALISSAMVPNKDNLNAVVVNTANTGMFIDVTTPDTPSMFPGVISDNNDFIYADKVAYNFKDGYVTIALAGDAGNFVGCASFVETVHLSGLF